MSTLTLSRPLHAGLYFHVLSQLELEDTHASWVPFLRRAYQACPNRSYTQTLVLRVDSLEVLNKALSRGIPMFRDATGKNLLWNLKQALATEEAEFSKKFRPESRDTTQVFAQLLKLQEDHWHPNPPPSLEVWDCDALRRGTSTQIHSTQRNAGTIIALSFDVSDEEFIAQVCTNFPKAAHE